MLNGDYMPIGPKLNLVQSVDVTARTLTIKEFPEETLTLQVTMDGSNCDFCFSKMGYPRRNAPSSCRCDSRKYELRVNFQNSLHDMSDNYNYRISLKLFLTQWEGELFSCVFRRRKMIEILKDNFLAPRFIEKLNWVQLHVKIERSTVKPSCKNNDKIADLYDRLLEFNQDCETILIQVSGKEFKVLKQILIMRSPVFEAMFSSEMSESQNNIVKIDDFDADAIETMLQYIYTNKTKNIHKKPFEVYEAAHKYGIKDLQDKCVEWMLFNINNDRFVSVARIATVYELTDLKNGLRQYVKSNEEDLVKREDFRDYLLATIDINSIVDTLELCSRYPSKLNTVKESAFQFLGENIESVIKQDGFLKLFGDEFSQELVKFLLSKNNDTGERSKIQNEECT